MFEKVNKYHPDKLADRIAGAVVDLVMSKDPNAKAAVEVLIGHNRCHVINETSVVLDPMKVTGIVSRIAGEVRVDYLEVRQDEHLAANQADEIRCGDNGIFKGVPFTNEQIHLNNIARVLENKFGSDGKYIIDESDFKLIVCQSNATEKEIKKALGNYKFSKVIINPLGEWTGGTDVDCGATNRKLGSDMADSVTGGGLMGKDLSKADVSVNIYCWLLAQKRGRIVETSCAIGDKELLIDGVMVPYKTIVEVARDYITKIGGFEAFAEHGFVFDENLF